MCNDNGQSLAQRFRSACDAVSREGEAALPALAELYDPQVQFIDPLQSVVGLDAVTEAKRRLLRRARSLSIDVGDLAEQGEQLFATWSMALEPRVGPSMVIEGVTHATVREGRIVYQRDYWDLLSSAADAVPMIGMVYRQVVGLFV